jgi:hypothetical protein
MNILAEDPSAWELPRGAIARLDLNGNWPLIFHKSLMKNRKGKFGRDSVSMQFNVARQMSPRMIQATVLDSPTHV